MDVFYHTSPHFANSGSAPQGRPDPCAPSQGAPRSGGGCIVAGYPIDPDRSDMGTTPSLPAVGSPLRGGTRALPRQTPGRRCRQPEVESAFVGCSNVRLSRRGGPCGRPGRQLQYEPALPIAPARQHPWLPLRDCKGAPPVAGGATAAVGQPLALAQAERSGKA